MKKLLASLAVVGSLIGVGGVLASPAGATSMPAVSATLQSLIDDSNAITTAASSTDLDGAASACDSLATDASTLASYHRPGAFPKAAWRHLMRAARYEIQSGTLCAEGARELDVAKIDQATSAANSARDELKAANRLM
jgi:hypothetical protein